MYFSEPFTRWQARQDLILYANHKDGIFIVRGNVVNIKRGQVGRSQHTMKKRWKRGRSKIENFLKLLENTQQISTQKNNITTVLTIVNYDRRQADQHTDQQTDEPQTSHRPTTNNNDNNDNNDKEEETKSQKKLFGKYVAMEEKEYEKLVGKYGAMFIEKKIAALDSYIADGKGKKYKDHYLTINKRSSKDIPEVGSLGEEYLKAIEGKNTAAKTRLENTHTKEKCVREMKTFLAGNYA